MQLQLVSQLIPETECIFLLGRVYGQVAGTPDSIEGCAAQICRTYDIPASVLMPQVAPLTEVERYVLRGLQVPQEELRFFFTCTNGILFADLAWALFFLDQAHIDFAALNQRRQLEELRHVISSVLNCDTMQLDTVFDSGSLAQFLDGYDCALSTKWLCQMFWYRPAVYQQRFREILQAAVRLFREAAPALDSLLTGQLPTIAAMAEDPSDFLQQMPGLPVSGPVALHPSAMWFNGIGMVSDQNPSGPPVLQMQVGILYQTLQKLVSKYKNRNELLVNAAWSLGDTRRMEILTALRTRSLCNQELSEMLSLSAATVSHHMSYLVQNGFVVTTKNGSRQDYALNPEGIRVFIEMIQSSLL